MRTVSGVRRHLGDDRKTLPAWGFTRGFDESVERVDDSPGNLVDRGHVVRADAHAEMYLVALRRRCNGQPATLRQRHHRMPGDDPGPRAVRDRRVTRVGGNDGV